MTKIESWTTNGDPRLSPYPLKIYQDVPMTHIWVATDDIFERTKAIRHQDRFMKFPYSQELFTWLFGKSDIIFNGRRLSSEYHPTNHYIALGIKREEDLRDFLLLVKFERFNPIEP